MSARGRADAARPPEAFYFLALNVAPPTTAGLDWAFPAPQLGRSLAAALAGTPAAGPHQAARRGPAVASIASPVRGKWRLPAWGAVRPPPGALTDIRCSVQGSAARPARQALRQGFPFRVGRDRTGLNGPSSGRQPLAAGSGGRPGLPARVRREGCTSRNAFRPLRSHNACCRFLKRCHSSNGRIRMPVQNYRLYRRIFWLLI